jgi:hypothetical protein
MARKPKKEEVTETPETTENQVSTETQASTEEGVRVRPDISNYQKARASSGALSHHNGDPVATAVEGATPEEVYSLAASVLEVDVSELEDKYKHLNIGMQRMNLGNRMRGVVNKLNKAEEGSGDAYITEMASGLRETIDAREQAAAEAKAKLEAEKQAKAKAKEEAVAKAAAKAEAEAKKSAKEAA